ncbi:MAG: hypothetical protein IT445_13030 [Phycisphaeraceae bacterium]|nr:hypothetical protein [Phycisphaeraceae bacterium]
MARILLAAFVGSVILYVWGVLAWLVLPIHSGSVRDLYGAQQPLQQLATVADKPGVYVFPPLPAELNDPQVYQAAAHVHEQGPVGVLVIDPDGAALMPPGTFVIGYLLNLLAASVAAMLLAATRVRRYLARVGFVVLLGLLPVLLADAMNWNWMHYPADYTLAMIVDRLIGFLLLGLALGVIIRMPGPGQA